MPSQKKARQNTQDMVRQNKSTKPIERILATPWYPIALGAYPVLALVAANIGQVQASAGSRVLLISITLVAIVYAVAWLALRQPHRAAFITLLLLIAFFAYGHVFDLLKQSFPTAPVEFWLPIDWSLALTLALVVATRPRFKYESATPGLNLVAVGLLAVSIWQVTATPAAAAHTLGAENAPVDTDLVMPSNPPDVYFFLLDSYGRADGLMDAYNYDNSAFINGLEQRGFYVAACSQSNYVRTEISLASSLNMTYLQDLDEAFRPDTTDRRVLWNSLKRSAVRYEFESLGYEMVTFETGFDWLDIRDDNIFIAPPPLSSGMSEFEGLFLRTTAARYFQDLGWVDPDAVFGQKYRDLFNNIFDHIGAIAAMPEPTFAYLHVISPHPPFVFAADGSPTYPPDFWNADRKYPPDLYAAGYQNQLTHLNKKMLEAIDTILQESDTPPIIIIQGDHGPWLQPKNKRMWILNAYYLPGHKDDLYPTITPVNSFRLVFDAYFRGHYGMLDDVSYFSPVPNLYDFSEIPNNCVE